MKRLRMNWAIKLLFRFFKIWDFWKFIDWQTLYVYFSVYFRKIPPPQIKQMEHTSNISIQGTCVQHLEATSSKMKELSSVIWPKIGILRWFLTVFWIRIFDRFVLRKVCFRVILCIFDEKLTQKHVSLNPMYKKVTLTLLTPWPGMTLTWPITIKSLLWYF